VFLGVVKQAKANTVSVAQGIRAEIAAVKPTLPEGCDLWVAYDSSVHVEKAITEVWETLGIAFALVVLIIFVFLRNLRSTIIPAVAIPVSLVGSFAFLYWLGYSVNILTMLALVLSIGIVVDDAIVVLEAIYRHIEEGMPPMKAAFKAMEEISFAVIAITISLVAVFVPLAFFKSTTGRLFIEFAIAISGAVVISAFVALTLTPAMAARVLKPLEGIKHGSLFNWFERGFNGVSRLYGRGLRWALHHRIFMLMVTLGTLVLMFFSFQGLEREFLPLEDKSRMFCIVFTPNGSTSEFTDRQLQKAEKIVASVPEVETFGAMVAPAFAGPGQANMGVIFVRFKDKSQRDRSVQEIVHGPGGVAQRFFMEVEGGFAIPNLPKAIEVTFRDSPFELILQNQDLDALNKVSQDIANKIRAMTKEVNGRPEPYLNNVRVGFEVDKPELRVTIDRSRAASLGVSVEDISRTMQILFGGLDLSRIKVGGKEYYVMAQLERKSRLTPQDLDKNFVRNNQGELIQLSSLVTRTQGAAPNAINHYGRLRSSSITASTGTVPIGSVVGEVEKMLATELPPGFLYAWGGDAKSLAETSTEVWWVLGLAIVIIYMTLAAQFESLVHPITVMLALPLAAIGAFGLLWLLNFGGKLGLYPPIPAMNINLFSLVGLVLLIGLVTKNSILLVEFANQQVATGLESHEAMTRAGLVRLRPILMTTCSTIAGILPIAIGFGAGAESRRPMGIAVVGGLLTSTFLTLFIVPVVYTFFSDVAAKFQRKRAPQAMPADVAPVAK
jgi:multidrug efflux pump